MFAAVVVQLAKDKPDGHSILLATSSTNAAAPHLYAKLGFDPLTDFTPVIALCEIPNVMVVPTKSPWNSLQELVAAAKKDPGQYTYGSAGIGGSQHLAGAQFKTTSGADIRHVPYKGGAQAITDLIGGQVDVMFNGMVATYPHVKAGKIKLIAISSAKRNAQMPDTPTVAESLPGFLTGSFQGLLAPAGTPKAVIDKVHAEVQRIAALPEVRERLNTLGAEPSAMSPADFGQWLKSEIPAMAKIVKDEKITVE